MKFKFIILMSFVVAYSIAEDDSRIVHGQKTDVTTDEDPFAGPPARPVEKSKQDAKPDAKSNAKQDAKPSPDPFEVPPSNKAGKSKPNAPAKPSPDSFEVPSSLTPEKSKRDVKPDGSQVAEDIPDWARVSLKRHTSRTYCLAYQKVFQDLGSQIRPFNATSIKVRVIGPGHERQALVTLAVQLDRLRVPPAVTINATGAVFFQLSPRDHVLHPVKLDALDELITANEPVVVQAHEGLKAEKLALVLKKLKELGAIVSRVDIQQFDDKPAASADNSVSEEVAPNAAGTSGAYIAPDQLTPTVAVKKSEFEWRKKAQSARTKLSQAEQRAVQIAKQKATATGTIRGPSSARQNSQRLRREVEHAFAARQQLQRAELQLLRTRLMNIEKSIADRERNKNRIIEYRVQELLHPSLQWPARPSSNKNETNTSGLTNNPIINSAQKPIEPTDLKSRRVALARQRFELIINESRAGRGSFDSILSAANDLVDAEMQAIGKPAQKANPDARLKVLRQHIARLEAIKKQAEVLVKTGMQSRAASLATEAAFLKAQQQLNREYPVRQDRSQSRSNLGYGSGGLNPASQAVSWPIMVLQAELATAESRLQRIEKTNKSGYSSARELDDAKATVVLARTKINAAIQQHRAKERLLKLDCTKFELLAESAWAKYNQASSKELLIPSFVGESVVPELHRVAQQANLAVKRAQIVLEVHQDQGGSVVNGLSSITAQPKPKLATVEAAAAFISAGLGVKLERVSREAIPNQRFRGGLRVLEVVSKGAAKLAGFRKGDVLVGLRNYETLSIDNVVWVLLQPVQSKLPGRPQVMTAHLLRDGEYLTTTLIDVGGIKDTRKPNQKPSF